MKTYAKILIMIGAMGLVLGAGAGVYRLVQYEKDKAFENARVVRVEEYNTATDELKNTITEISGQGSDEIKAYIDEHAYIDEAEKERAHDDEQMKALDPWNGKTHPVASSEADLDNEASNNMESVDSTIHSSVSGNSFQDESVSDNNIDESVSGNSVSGNSISGNSISGNSVSGNSVSGNSVSGNSVSGNSVSGNGVSGNSISGNSVSDSSISEQNMEETRITLSDRQALRTSYEETHLWMEADEELLNRTSISFKDKKIACLGDSITEAANLLNEPDYAEYPYPKKLSELLGAKVQNLGIGGSSYGRYWYEPFCERYQSIDEDTDIILVLGGTNDGYCLSEDLVGSIDECKPRTLYGDIDDLYKGLKADYPQAKIYILTPMPNLLHDVLRKERPELLPQSVVVNAVLEVALKNDLEVIDLYNSNFFDSHDADVVKEFLPDSVHPNPDGYEVLAKHIAAEMIRSMEKEKGIAAEPLEEALEAEVTPSAEPLEEASEAEVTPTAEPEEEASEEEITPTAEPLEEALEAEVTPSAEPLKEASEEEATREASKETPTPQRNPQNLIYSRDE